MYQIKRDSFLRNFIKGLLFYFILAVIPHTGFAATGDEFEPDDDFNQARVIIKGDAPENHSHTFHTKEDVDWLVFSAIAGKTYAIEISNVGSGIDPKIELYRADGLNFLMEQDNGLSGEGESIDYECTEDGLYYIRMSNYKDSYINDSVGYNVKVYIPEAQLDGKIIGSIFNEITLKAVPRAMIDIYSIPDNIVVMNGLTATNDGVFYITQIETGFYDLVVTHSGYYQKTVGQVEAVNSNELPHQEIGLTPKICGSGDVDNDGEISFEDIRMAWDYFVFYKSYEGLDEAGKQQFCAANTYDHESMGWNDNLHIYLEDVRGVLLKFMDGGVK